MNLSPGTRVGNLEVVSLLGTGGMGEVYRAHDTRLKRDIALKVLPNAWTADPERVARFRREAELLATLNHANIAAVYGVEEVEGIHAIVLELVEGPTLADRLEQGPIRLTEALSIARQIADGLDAAHERGIIHRDLKPANIKLRDDGTVKVLDFGLAKAVDGPADGKGPDPALATTLTSPAMTRAGVILGTPAYMSPEQARGLAVDKRTDIWAFGCVLYEMLAGRSAFGGPTVSDTIAAILERAPDWPALPVTTPSSIRHLVERCLEKERRRRLRDIGDARADLDRVETGMDPPLGVRRSGRLRWFLAGASLAIAALAAAGLFWRRGDADRLAASSSSGPRLTRVTSDASYSTEPALSPDGTVVVYASDRDGKGQLDLWLQRTTGDPPLRLTDNPADDRDPDISPDGSTIAFRSDRDGGGIYLMSVLRGDARLIAPRGRSPRFSRDGKRLAYAVPSSWLGALNGLPSALFVIPVTGGAATRIAEGVTIAAFPLWSPDGRSLLFFGGASQAAGDWWWVPVDGGTPVATGAYRVIRQAGLSGESDNPDIVPATWTKDGVLFSARLGDSVNVWRLQISERSGQADDASLERLTHGTGADIHPSVDNLGRIAFQVASDVAESLTLPLNPNAAAVTGPIVAQTFETGEGSSRSSLDDRGRLLAYPRRRGTELWVKDLSTERERHVLTAPGVANPIVSHDGTMVAFTQAEGSDRAGYVVPLASGTPKKMCDRCDIHGWFADNRRILTLQWEAGASIAPARAIDTVTLTAVDLIKATGRMSRLDLSPDERWLTFGRGGTFQLAPVRPGSGLAEEREWVKVFERTPGSAERPCGWSPDGRFLYLLLERDGFRDLYAQRIDTAKGVPVGEPVEVEHFHDPRRRWGSTSYGSAIVSNAFVFTQVETTGSIWLLQP